MEKMVPADTAEFPRRSMNECCSLAKNINASTSTTRGLLEQSGEKISPEGERVRPHGDVDYRVIDLGGDERSVPDAYFLFQQTDGNDSTNSGCADGSFQP